MVPYLIKSPVYWDLPNFYIMLFPPPFSGTLPGYHNTFTCLASLGSSGCDSFCLISDDFESSLVRNSIVCSSNGICLMFLSGLGWDYGFREEDYKSRVSFSLLPIRLMPVNVDLGHKAEVGVLGFSIMKLLFFSPPFHTVLFGWKSQGTTYT